MIPPSKSSKHGFTNYANWPPDYRNTHDRTHKASSRERGLPKNHREVSDFRSKSTDGSSGNPSKISSIYYYQQSSNVSGNKLHKPKEITPVQVSIQCHRQEHNL
ncbi:hypothetical protein AVEN_76425-1 [Araneus ventricosus]|uniref:Uncharacterized protein n=1 Tax=Araneus ventricosus TaxID=182803 RepID=A0A4Y2VJ44_ARAVE|nr:hypothetical protein AVEN_76425-1 [Araneus ventricosus]